MNLISVEDDKIREMEGLLIETTRLGLYMVYSVSWFIRFATAPWVIYTGTIAVSMGIGFSMYSKGASAMIFLVALLMGLTTGSVVLAMYPKAERDEDVLFFKASCLAVRRILKQKRMNRKPGGR
jgi:FtsH-binding integral membrane protein